MNCRSCGSSVKEVLDMGMMPLAGDFRIPGSGPCLEYPLAIDACGKCGLLQVRDTVPREALFNADYRYSSSTVPGLVKHFEGFADYIKWLGEPRPLHKCSLLDIYEGRCSHGGNSGLLLEIGCNDGVLMDPLRGLGIKSVGIDASDNVAQMARDKGLDVHTGFFGRESAETLVAKYGRFDAITCSNVFAHNPDLQDFLAGIDIALRDGGTFIVEVHDARILHDGLQWDFFCHEHCYYWTFDALASALEEHGFGAYRAESTSMHGGGLRATFFRRFVWGWVEGRDYSGSLLPDAWDSFRFRAEFNRDLLRRVVKDSRITTAYGASGRSAIMIRWAGLEDQIERIVDGSPLRIGRLLPGTNIPIVSEAEFLSGPNPGTVLVTAYPYADGIKAKIDSAWDGVPLIVPIPQVRVI